MRAPKTFEEGLQRLQELLAKMQDETTTLDQSVKLYAVWRTLAKKHKNYLTSEARGLMAVYRQKEGEPEDE